MLHQVMGYPPEPLAPGDDLVHEVALMKASGDRVIVRVRQLMADEAIDRPPDDADPTVPLVAA